MSAAPRWEVGQELEPRELLPVTRLDLIRYAGASGDYNPIHTLDEAAAEAGLPGVIQHGMRTMGQLAALLTPYLAHGHLRELRTRFTGMVGVGDVLTLTGRVTAAEPEGEGATRYAFELRAVNGRGDPVAVGRAVLVVFEP